MEMLWYGVVSVMLAVYVVLDGFDLGAGALHLFVAKNDTERRTVLAAIGPVWDGNEVWLLAGGGALFLAFPFPYIANTAGWMTAELARQPWAIYGLLRTAAASSPRVEAGDAIFTFLGFCGLYLVVGVLFLYLLGREIAHGPEASRAASGGPKAAAAHAAGRA